MKKILLSMVVILLFAVPVFAAPGDMIINGNLTVGGTISAPTISSPNVMTKFYESPEQTVAQTITVAHGLGSKPRIVRVVARCKTAEQGYAVGDEADVTFGGYYNNMGYFTTADASNIVWIMVNPGVLRLAQKNDPAAIASLTHANWRIVVYAFGQ